MHHRWNGTRNETAAVVEDQEQVEDSYHSHYQEGVEGSTVSHSHIPRHHKGPEIFTETRARTSAQVNTLAETEEAEVETPRVTT
jgi:hypothetical protein